MQRERESRIRRARQSVAGLSVVLLMCCAADAAPYNLNGYWVDVDYWAGSGASETIVVIDWNQTNGPYDTEAHAWGYRWDGDQYVSDAITAICAAGPLEVTTNYGGAFLDHAFYFDPQIDDDQHTSDGWAGWWWAGDTLDGGQTWNLNAGGITEKLLGDGRIEGFNMDAGNWTSDTLTIPVPEPSTLATLLACAALAARRR
ncbi:MAG: hypothetical protein KKB50_03190 [Planctomycetes bacterium]|nr:hypothetical protein [Planctomycetota bacterium]